MMLSEIHSISLREQVVDRIRTAIIEGRLKPNDHVVEQALTEQLRVSRTPVREALILLEREGLLVASRNRGCFVRVFTPEDVLAIFSMRTTLENFAGELIMDRLSDADHEHLDFTIEVQRQHIERGDFKNVRSTDMSFHRFLIERSEHPLLMRSWAELVAQIAALLYVRAEAIPDYDEYLAIRDHQAIADAYRRRDIEALRAVNKRINERVAGECCRGLEPVVTARYQR
ncbi:MAG: GntR family transcriptional regulator [Chloroflexota bacterium]|nr:GntR family transcriptional regulator [Chloroflexota bacterium]